MNTRVYLLTFLTFCAPSYVGADTAADLMASAVRSYAAKGWQRGQQEQDLLVRAVHATRIAVRDVEKWLCHTIDQIKKEIHYWSNQTTEDRQEQSFVLHEMLDKHLHQLGLLYESCLSFDPSAAFLTQCNMLKRIIQTVADIVPAKEGELAEFNELTLLERAQDLQKRIASCKKERLEGIEHPSFWQRHKNHLLMVGGSAAVTGLVGGLISGTVVGSKLKAFAHDALVAPFYEYGQHSAKIEATRPELVNQYSTLLKSNKGKFGIPTDLSDQIIDQHAQQLDEQFLLRTIKVGDSIKEIDVKGGWTGIKGDKLGELLDALKDGGLPFTTLILQLKTFPIEREAHRLIEKLKVMIPVTAGIGVLSGIAYALYRAYIYRKEKKKREVSTDYATLARVLVPHNGDRARLSTYDNGLVSYTEYRLRQSGRYTENEMGRRALAEDIQHMLVMRGSAVAGEGKKT